MSDKMEEKVINDEVERGINSAIKFRGDNKILSNIESLGKAIEDLEFHCLCFNHIFSKNGDLVVYLPLGYCIDSFTIERKTKVECCIVALEKLEELWIESML